MLPEITKFPKIAKRRYLPPLMVALGSLIFLGTTLSEAAALAYRVYVPGLLGSSGSGTPTPPPESEPATELSIALASAALPDGRETSFYNKGQSYNLSQLANIIGETGPINYSDISWSISSGALPTGMSLVTGWLTGTPTTKTGASGQSFQVTASYKSKTGQQTYTIKVFDQYLDVVAIAPGGAHTCAITDTGRVKCWGHNGSGQLGAGATAAATELSPVDVIGLSSGVTQLSAGFLQTCAVLTGGAVKCWGNNENGELGDGTNISRNEPVAVSGLSSGVASVHTGFFHTCAVTTSGTVKCWGKNGLGQLGDLTTANKNIPVTVPGLAGVTKVSFGGDASCALTSAGAVKCWGEGLGGASQSYVPVAISGLESGVSGLSVGRYFGCAKMSSGTVKCWGSGGDGELGNGTTSSSTSAVSVSGLTGVSRISSGAGHTCATLNAGGIKCWGLNSSGQFGNGTTTSSSVPVSTLNLPADTITSITTGQSYTCITLSSGYAQCWGYNGYGGVGDGTIVQKRSPTYVRSGF